MRSTDNSLNETSALIKAIISEEKIQSSPAMDSKGVIEGSSYSTNFIYPYSNDLNFCDSLELMENRDPAEILELPVAVVVGESHILSILPEIAKHASIVIMNDIAEQVHAHNSHLLLCLGNSDSPADFLKKYLVDNPLEKIYVLKPDSTVGKVEKSLLEKRLRDGKEYLKNKHFLSSQKRFEECKSALLKLNFVKAKVNFFSEESCNILSKLLNSFHATITLINLSNLHDYNNQKILQKTIHTLLENSFKPFILYSLGGIGNQEKLQGCITTETNIYFNQVLNNEPRCTASIKRSKIISYLDKYDTKKGIIRKIAGNSAEMKKLKQIVTENKEEKLSANAVIKINKIIQDHMAALSKPTLTTKTLKQIEIDFQSGISFGKLPSIISLNILSWLIKSEIFTISQVNKEFYHLSRLQCQNKLTLFRSPAAKTFNTDPIHAAIILQLTQYKVNREKRHKFRVSMDGIFDKHIKRLNNFKKLIISIFSLNKENPKNKDILNCLSMINNINGKRKTINKIPEVYQSFFSFYEYIFNEDLCGLQSSIDLMFMSLIVMEINYAKKHSSQEYKKTLEYIFHIYLSKLDKTKFQHFCDDQYKFATKEIDLLKASELWDVCLVWKGYGGYGGYHEMKIADPDIASEQYTNGRYERTTTRFAGYVESGSEFGAFSLPSYETTTVVVLAGIDSDIRYFYPYRERVKIFEEMSIIVKDLVNMLGETYTNVKRKL